MQKIYISNDHTAVEMKKDLIKHLTNKGYEMIDLGNNDSLASNYAELGIELGEHVMKDQGSLGIVICGTGVGISIAANKVKGIRAGLVYEVQTAELIKQHNDANVIALGARMIANDKAIKIVDKFLETSFEGGRHIGRVNTINEYK